jgi:hypothetical protein
VFLKVSRFGFSINGAKCWRIIVSKENRSNTINVESKLNMRIWLFLFTGGTGLACLWMFSEGIKFESNFSLVYIALGLFGMTFGLITFFTVFRSFTKKGNILFSITQGEDGQIISRKKSVYLKDIKVIEMSHHFYRPSGILFEDLIIRTDRNNLIRIPLYGLLGDFEFNDYVDNYIFPYMTEEGQQIWKKRHDKTTIT